LGGLNQQIREIEAALVGHWSHLGQWAAGALVDMGGVLRYETPIPHLPYNGVLRTAITERDPGEAVNAVVESFQRRGVPFIWWEHPSCMPQDLGSHLDRNGLAAVERVTGMAIDLDNWNDTKPHADVRFVEVLDTQAMEAYEDLIVRYWELPPESQAMVASLNRFWGPGKLPAHRWVAYIDDIPVGKALLSLAAPKGVAAVYGMSVTPEARGRGIAGGLTTTLLKRAKALGCQRVVLHSSQIAVDVYRRAGFIDCCSMTVYATAPLWSGANH
jgi:GNAT superfamily N-acetyltransferase